MLITLYCLIAVPLPTAITPLLKPERHNARTTSFSHPMYNETGNVTLRDDGRDKVHMPPDFELQMINILPVILTEECILMAMVMIVENLAMSPWNQRLSHDQFHWEGYEDIYISFDPNPTRQVKHALWSLYLAITLMGRMPDYYDIEFRASQTLHGAVVDLGVVSIRSNRRSPRLENAAKNVTMHDIPGLAAKQKATAFTTREREVSLEFNGDRLPVLGIIINIVVLMVAQAGMPRDPQPLLEFDQEFNNLAMHTYMDFWKLPVPPGGELYHEDVIFTLASLPGYVFDQDRFREGRYLLLTGAEKTPVASGDILKSFGPTVR